MQDAELPDGAMPDGQPHPRYATAAAVSDWACSTCVS